MNLDPSALRIRQQIEVLRTAGVGSRVIVEARIDGTSQAHKAVITRVIDKGTYLVEFYVGQRQFRSVVPLQRLKLAS